MNGERHSVHIQVPDRDDLGLVYEKDLAKQLFVEVSDLDDVFDNWTPEQLVEHLEKQDPQELRRRVFGIK